MKAKLYCTSGKYEGKTYHIKSEATIGRSGENDIVLDEMVVSNSHARIYFDTGDKQFYIDDLNSRTGIMIGEDFVEERHPLNEGDILTIGNAFEFRFMIAKTAQEPAEAKPSTADEQPRTSKAPESETDLVADVPSEKLQDRTSEAEEAAQTAKPEKAEKPAKADTSEEEPESDEERVSAFYFESTSLDGTEEHHSLITGVNLVGREASNRLILKDGSVSRHHAVVIAKSNEVIVRDLDSKNGTYVDGDKVTEDTAASEGARIMFGLVSFTLRRKA
ncbi:MAG: hypothetical protein CL946_13830 [Ectothiorhodospiraceae bacterium]|nr:hypothetical protein [Ectothiorhodospiraceae bacterium]